MANDYRVLIRKNIIMEQAVGIKNEADLFISFQNTKIELTPDELAKLKANTLDEITLLTVAQSEKVMEEKAKQLESTVEKATDAVKQLDDQIADLQTNKQDKLDLGDSIDPEDAYFVGISDLLSGTDAGSKILALDLKLTAEDTAMKTRIADLETKETSNANQIAAFGSSTEITTLKTDAAKAKTDITALQSADTTLLTEINKVKAAAADKTAIDAANAEITKLKNDKADKTELTTLDGKITTNTSDIATMKATVNTAGSTATTAKNTADTAKTTADGNKGDITQLKTTTAQNTAAIQVHGTDISTLKNAASLVDVIDMSADLPVTEAKIKTALVVGNKNLPNGDSKAGEFVLVKESAAGTVYEFWLADTTTAGGWTKASTTLEINLGEYQRRGKNSAAGTGYAPGLNMVLIGATNDHPTWTNIKDALETAFAFDTVNDEGKVLTIEGGKLVQKEPGVTSTDIVLNESLADTAFAINKGDLLVANEVDSDGKVSKISGTTIKPVIAETDAGGVTPLTTHANKIAYGGVSTQKIKYIANPGTAGKVLTSQATGHPEWETTPVSVGTVAADDVAIIEAVDADGNITVGKAGFDKTYVTGMRTELDTAKASITTNATNITTNTTAIDTNKTTAEGARDDLDEFKLKAFGLAKTDSVLKPGWADVLAGKQLTQAEKDKIGNLPDDTNNALDGKQKALPDATKEALGLNADGDLKVTDSTDAAYIVPFTKALKTIAESSTTMKVENSAGTQVLATTMDGTDDDKLLITKKEFLAEIKKAKASGAGTASATKTVMKKTGVVKDYMAHITSADQNNRNVKFWHKLPPELAMGEVGYINGKQLARWIIDATAVSDDGAMIAFAVSNKVYFSTNNGTTWTEHTVSGSVKQIVFRGSMPVILSNRLYLILGPTLKDITPNTYGSSLLGVDIFGPRITTWDNNNVYLSITPMMPVFVALTGVRSNVLWATSNMKDTFVIYRDGVVQHTGRGNIVSSFGNVSLSGTGRVGDVRIKASVTHCVVYRKHSTDLFQVPLMAFGSTSFVNINPTRKTVIDVTMGFSGEALILYSHSIYKGTTSEYDLGTKTGLDISRTGDAVVISTIDTGKKESEVMVSSNVNNISTNLKTIDTVTYTTEKIEIFTLGIDSTGNRVTANYFNRVTNFSKAMLGKQASERHHHALVIEVDKEENKVYCTEKGKVVEIGNVQLSDDYHLEIETSTATTIADGTTTGGDTSPTPVT